MEFGFTPEQQLIRKQVIEFARGEIAPRAREHDLRAEFDAESFRKLGEFGLLGLHFPEELGGGGVDVVTSVVAAEALGEAGVDGGLLLSFGAHTYLCADTIYRHGTQEQKKKYVPRLASGEWIGCMGLTEPNAGSDVAALSTRADRVEGGYLLNGSKMFITNGPVADVAVVYARTSSRGERHEGISAFVLEKGMKGFRPGKKLDKLGVRGSATSELIFEDCLVPESALLGREGGGFIMALETVEWDRSTLIAPFIGGMTFALEKSCRYSLDRIQFGRPIARFQAVQHRLADMRIFIEAARNLVYNIAWCKDQGRPVNHLEAAVTKLFVGDYGIKPAFDAVMVHGGYGYCHEYDVERVLRDACLAPIGGGTSEVQKMVISKMLQVMGPKDV
jgi:butyryl-CoA dehydrogenase